MSVGVDRDQLAALNALRRGFGQVEVLAVLDPDALSVLNNQPQPAPTQPAAMPEQPARHVQSNLPDQSFMEEPCPTPF
jgi:hypothetical protein